MVLFKRKPVRYLSSPIIEDDSTEIWVIPQTEELFVDYEAYLNRMDFYKQRRFICQITGHSGLTFFEALKSEVAGAREVEEAFPEALKGPILRRVQFQTISRIDNLTDLIYEEFKADYYPGEAVSVHVVTGERLTGVVRDKTRFGSKMNPDGTQGAPFSRYFVSLDNRPNEEAVVDDAHISRDRKIFTKQVLRGFLKNSLTREAWTGAPWLVKPEQAAMYHIDTRVPPHLRYESKAAERKLQQQQKRSSLHAGENGTASPNGAKLPELKPKSHKSKQQQQAAKDKQKLSLNPAPQKSAQFIAHSVPFVPHTFTTSEGPQFAQFQNANFPFAPITSSAQPTPPAPPPIKYPIEDLDIAPRPDMSPRPKLKFFSEDTPGLSEKELKKIKDSNVIRMESVGLLLESWDTLNVYCEIFKLDSFTFDDFVEAMEYSSVDLDCELFTEAHCAALKLLVEPEADGGNIQVQLPESDEESDEEEEEEEEEEERTPTPEPEPRRSGRTTRSSLAKAEADAIQAGTKRAESVASEPKITHSAAEMQVENKWDEKLAKRDFKNGGWQVIVVGLLYRLSKDPHFEKSCLEILEHLAPVDMPATQETALLQYSTLDINLRARALQIICMLTAQTKAVRGYMEECSEQMTSFRKEKIQWQRDRKFALEDLRVLNEERKILLPDNMPPSPELEKTSETPKPAPITKLESEDIVDDSENMDTDDDAPRARALRGGNDRALQRQKKREEEEERKKKAEAAAKIPKPSKAWTKLLKDIQKKQDFIKKCEDEIATLDNDLREADCPRTRVLGKDRFWNRYYWFERNGMPYAGLPNSSTADAGYANGCIWVQGPDDLEREGYIDFVPRNEKEDHKLKFGMTVPERKKKEEGETSVYNARQWGYIDDPEAVEALMTWLDPRGFNELKLKKELTNYKDKIIHNMEKRKEYLDPDRDEKKDKAGNKKSSPAAKRMSTRTKHQPHHADPSVFRCLAWHNTTALREQGHLHSEQPRSRKPTKKAYRD